MTRQNLTASQLVTALSKLDPATVVTTCQYDGEWCYWYEYGISGIGEDGQIVQGELVRSGSDYDDDDDLGIDDDDA